MIVQLQVATETRLQRQRYNVYLISSLQKHILSSVCILSELYLKQVTSVHKLNPIITVAKYVWNNKSVLLQ